MTLRIAVTICDYGAALHTGADPYRMTDIIEIPDELIPGLLKAHFEHLRAAAERKEKYGRDDHVYQTASLSLMLEPKETA